MRIKTRKVGAGYGGYKCLKDMDLILWIKFFDWSDIIMPVF